MREGACAAGARLAPLRHVAVIMDGNGRWAKRRNLPPGEGHKRGAEALRRCVGACLRHGVPFLTVFGFSHENWRRPGAEVATLMSLLRRHLGGGLCEFIDNGVALRAIGAQDRLPEDIAKSLAEAQEKTKGSVRLTLTLALDYGGRQDILGAARKAAKAIASGEIAPEALDEECFARFLSTAGVPDPDLVIRTSGEVRLSNFLLWQLAYSELYFTATCWPDFSEAEFEDALAAYACRERRYGARRRDGRAIERR